VKVVLITGAASGLGWAMAQVFHGRGDCVCLVDINEPLLAQRKGELGDACRVMTVSADVTRAEDIQSLLAQVEERFGRLDVLVNNAGITHRSLAADTDPAVLRKVMAVDWQGPMELALGSLPLLRASQGAIINIGSMAGWMPVLGRAGYCSAKSALAQFFEVLRGELSRDGVHILMVYPSFLDTPIETNALGHDGKPAGHARSMVGRMGDANELAGRIVEALDRKRPRLFPDRFTFFASLLWRLAPNLFQHLMVKKFASELDQRGARHD
jgi:NAD(P)-dependent dehydrogenase (short-subunit alcohol dehydrogenase family)